MNRAIDLHDTKSLSVVSLLVISLLAIALICSSCTKLNVFALKRGPISCKPPTGLDLYLSVECCQDETDNKGITITWCTICNNTQPPSHCDPRYQNKENPPVPPKSPPPIVNTEPPSVAPSNNTSPTTTGLVEQPPTSNAPPSPSKTSQRGFSPTGGCIPGGTTCIPCDPGLATHGANCIPSGDWHPGGSGLGTEFGGGTSTPPTIQQPPAQSGVVEQPPTNLGSPSSSSSTNDNVNNNNLPPSDNHHKSKGNNILDQIGGGTGKQSATK
jgi:hypothetical protein